MENETKMMNRIPELQSKVLQWGKEHLRDYPWRHTRDPYKIMIAEFMLHRTRADQIVPIYNDFINKYPDVYALSKADPIKIRDATKHLGLHWRSQHIQKSAQYIIDKYSGTFPKTVEELRSIPGIGDYIAGAIITICYGKPHPVVDSNIARFINRYFGLNLTGELRRKKEIIALAGRLFNIENPRGFLFAILDFTAAICKPRDPFHSICPLKTCCKFYLEAGSFFHRKHTEDGVIKILFCLPR
ncbi:MAG: hypothetical protein QMD46_13690 [Methanomicrobiales archaeon]|nr:hypothetical protein [Methanomicrobiales archaeon]